MNSWEHRRHVEVYPTNGRAGIPGLLPTKLAVEAFSDRDRKVPSKLDRRKLLGEREMPGRKVPIPARQTEVTR